MYYFVMSAGAVVCVAPKLQPVTRVVNRSACANGGSRLALFPGLKGVSLLSRNVGP